MKLLQGEQGKVIIDFEYLEVDCKQLPEDAGFIYISELFNNKKVQEVRNGVWNFNRSVNGNQ